MFTNEKILIQQTLTIYLAERCHMPDYQLAQMRILLPLVMMCDLILFQQQNQKAHRHQERSGYGLKNK